MKHTGKKTYVLQHWKRLLGTTTRDFVSWTVIVISIISSLIAFVPEQTTALMQFLALGWPPALLEAVILAVAITVNWPRTRVVCKDKNTDIKVIIECCDLFEQNGLKVIHTVDTFDSELERIITPRSLHGAFLQLCRRKQVDIDRQINAVLPKLKSAGKDTSLPGRTDRYALGTLCPLQVNGDPYCWVAFTHLQPNGTITLTRKQYVDCLKTMWRNLADPRIRRDEVNVAVMGNRLVDLPAEFSTEQKIDLMIQTFFAVAHEKICCRTLRICVHPNNVSEVDFDSYPTVVSHLAKRPVL